MWPIFTQVHRSHEVSITQKWQIFVKYGSLGNAAEDMVSAHMESLLIVSIFLRDYVDYTRCKNWHLSEH